MRRSVVALGTCVAAVVVGFVGHGGAGVTAIGPGTVSRGTQVFVVGANGRGLHQLTYGPWAHLASLWMPNGAVADVTYTGKNRQKIWIESQRTNGAGHRDLSARVGTVAGPWPMAFSLASRLTAVETQWRHGFRLQTVGRPGSRQRTLDRWSDRWGNGSLSAAWSPDGRSIAYVRTMGPRYPDKAKFGGRFRLAIISPHTGVRRILTDLQASTGSTPAFSPDGRSILFSVQGRRRGLYIIPTRGGPAHRITDVGGEQLAWSPNGREIAYSATRRDHLDLFVANLRTGHIRRLAVGVATFGLATSPLAWSPNGRKIAFVQSSTPRKPFSSPTFRIETVDINGAGRARILVRGHTATLSGPTWSPDGRHIAYTVGPPENPYF